MTDAIFDMLNTFLKVAIGYMLLAIGVEVLSLLALGYFIRAFVLSLKRRKI